MKLPKNQRGFSAVEAILILVIISILGFAGWFVYNAQKSTNKALDDTSASQSTVATQQTKQTQAADQTGTVDGLVTFTYPSAWKLSQVDSEAYDGGTTQLTTITSPDGETYA